MSTEFSPRGRPRSVAGGRGSPARVRRNLVWGIVMVLALAHHDFWWWSDRALVLGVVPVGLFYHAVFSVGAGLTWALACRWAWPRHLEEWAETRPLDASGPSAHPTS